MSDAPRDALRHERIKALFLDALEIPAGERTSWLRTATRNDPAVLEEVATLLKAHAAAEGSGSLDTPLLARRDSDDIDDNDVADPALGRTVGAWRLTRRIGAGGMGAVYRAERADGAYEQTVAVKLLRPGGDLKMMAQRLRAERHLLARLEHPNVARLYDGGMTDEGLPFLVMEFIHGEPITAYATRRNLPLRERLELFLQVCDAVAFAHRNLIVHRDLKPNNVLVGVPAEAHGRDDVGRRVPCVKLLDFGIAKLLDDAEDAGLTRTGHLAMTPAYASPEQLRGEPVTTATDVYALGVLLYELLTERRPFDVRDKTVAEVERMVGERVPPKPSATGGQFGARLRGDADTIVLKAIEKEPGRRYASVEALAEDVRRHLSGRPVEARPATAAYRMRKFVARNRLPVGAAAALIVALVAGFSSTWWQSRVAATERDRAERRFNVAREAAAAMIYDIHGAVARVPGTTAARELIVSTSLSYLNHLAEEASGDVPLRLDLAEAYLRIGDVLGNPAEDNLGKIDEALASYERGLAVLPRPSDGDTLAGRVAMARASLHEEQGTVQAFSGDIDAALVSLDSSLVSYRLATLLAPDDLDRRVALAVGYINRGDYTGHPHFPNAGQPDSALVQYEQARVLLESIGEDVRGDGTRRMLGIVHERMGTLFLERGELDAALHSYSQSLNLREVLGRRNDASAEAIRDLGIAFEKVGQVYRAQGRPAEALEELQRAADIYASLAEADPNSVRARQTLAVSHIQRGDVNGGSDGATLGNRVAAARHYREALALLRPLAADTSNVYVRSLIEEAERKLGMVGGS